MARAAVQKKVNPIMACPVCLSDRLDTISPRMSKCRSCGFIWNHEVSDRDNLMLIVEHQSKREAVAVPPLRVLPSKKTRRNKKKKLRIAAKTR